MPERYRPKILTMAPFVLALLIIGVPDLASIRADEPKRWAVVIVGLPGDDEHGPLFEATTATWTKWLEASLHVAPERLLILSGPAANQRPATRDSLAKTFEELAGRIGERDSLWVMVLGHGHDDGRRAWLHVPGPDPETADLTRWLNEVRCREQIVWLTQASSGRWIKPLAKAGRIVITATDVEQEENETEFPHALATAMKASPDSLDLNADRRVSLAELFRAAVKATNARFASDERVATEHAQLDDDANGQGTEADQLVDESVPEPPADGQPTPNKTDRPKDGREAAKVILLSLPPA